MNSLLAITEKFPEIFKAVSVKRDEFAAWRAATWNNPPEPIIDFTNFAGHNWKAPGFYIGNVKSDFRAPTAQLIINGHGMYLGLNSQYKNGGTNFINFTSYAGTISPQYRTIGSFSPGFWRDIRNALIQERNRAAQNRGVYRAAMPQVFGSVSQDALNAENIHNGLSDSYDKLISILDEIINLDYRRKHWQNLFDELTNSQRRFDIIVNAMQRSAQLSELHQWLSVLDLVIPFTVPARTPESFPSNSGYYPGFWYTIEQLSEDIGHDLTQVNTSALVKELKVLLHVPQMTTSASATIASHESELRKTALNRAKALNEAENQKIREIQSAKTEARAITDRYFLAMEQMKLSQANLVSNMMVISSQKRK